MLKHIRAALAMLLVMTALTGLAYPLAITGLAQALFPDQAHGSLIDADGRIVGAALIAQGFSGPGYFHPRPSAAGTGYAADNAGASNLGASNAALLAAVGERVRAARSDNATNATVVPADLVTASGSGLDPHLSPAAAAWQVERVAKARGAEPRAIAALVAARTEGRQFGMLGEPRVNVLSLNMDLDRRWPGGR